MFGAEALGEFDGFVDDQGRIDLAELEFGVDEAEDGTIDRGLAVGGPIGSEFANEGIGVFAPLHGLRHCVADAVRLKGAKAGNAREDAAKDDGIESGSVVELEEDLKGEAANGHLSDALALVWRKGLEGIRRVGGCAGLTEHEVLLEGHEAEAFLSEGGLRLMGEWVGHDECNGV